jgi:hypothetical protein
MDKSYNNVVIMSTDEAAAEHDRRRVDAVAVVKSGAK